MTSVASHRDAIGSGGGRPFGPAYPACRMSQRPTGPQKSSQDAGMLEYWAAGILGSWDSGFWRGV